MKDGNTKWKSRRVLLRPDLAAGRSTNGKAGMLASIVWLATIAAPVAAPPAAAQPAGDTHVGVWEAVNYPADLELNDVFFVTPDVGWVTGGLYGNQGGGVILATRDGGASWDVQVGDPHSSEPGFSNLYFLDEHHGWALQLASFKYKILRTTDGETWEQVGSIDQGWGLMGYQFFTPATGVYLDGNNNTSRVMRTADGGRTWEEVWRCRATVQVQGLSRSVDCPLEAMHFPTPEVGYAIAESHGFLFVGKSVDGGRTWTVSTVPDIAGSGAYGVPTVFFIDEQTGFVGLENDKLYRTDDGGRTWKGLVGRTGAEIRFADPQVGWSIFDYQTVGFTIDGGKRWSSREISLPAKVYAFSLPRRDRGYVVGEHGMIYRYSVLPAALAPPDALTGPAMPAFGGPLHDYAEQLGAQVSALQLKLAEPFVHASISAEVANPVAGSEDGDVFEEVSYTAACCGEPLDEFWTTFDATAVALPSFLSQFRNLNLLVVAIRWAVLLPQRFGEIESAAQAFREAPDLTSASAALTRMEAAVQEFISATQQAFHKEMPAPGAYPDFVPGGEFIAIDSQERSATAEEEPEHESRLFDAVKDRLKKKRIFP